MNNNISWMGNKVVDPGGNRQTTPNATNSAQLQTQLPAQLQPQQLNQQGRVVLPDTVQGPPPSTEKGYIPNYLARNIGRNVKAEFIIGTSQFIDKSGILTEVGINYFVLRDVNSGTNIMCDLYSVKFVTVL